MRYLYDMEANNTQAKRFKGTKVVQQITSGETSQMKDVKYGETIFEVIHHRGTLEQIEADRQVIITAHELLESLQELYGAIDSCIELTPEVLIKARKTINKALKTY
jgi:hypothetical protein